MGGVLLCPSGTYLDLPLRGMISVFFLFPRLSKMYEFQSPRRTNASVAGQRSEMDLCSRWDRAFAFLLLLLAIGAMAGCQMFSGPGPSPTSGATGTLVANPSTINFGSVQVNSTQTHAETLTNTGGATVNISAAALSGAGFSTTGLNVPTTLTAGQSLTFYVTFTPSASGAVSGGLLLTSNSSVPSLRVALSGSGGSPGQLSVSPSTVNFGNVIVGVAQKQTVTAAASGASVTISSITTSNPEFALTGLSLPLTLAAGQSASLTVTFTPQASGVTSGTIAFASNASNAPTAETLTGTGTSASQHSVNLSWTASTSTVVGYNVYRGTQSGGPYVVLNSAPNASTTYTDATVQAGGTYYYVVNAVDASGNVSAYSKQAQAAIPTP